MNMERIFYKSDNEDAYTGLPIYIFDTSYLPSPESISYDEFIPTLMRVLPKRNYVLVMFSCGLNKISWIWGIKFLKTFLSSDSQVDNLNNLVKIITVHDSWFVKSITQILTNYNITKKNLSSLNKIFDNFTNININNIGDSILQAGSNSLHPQNLVINCSTLSDLTNYIDIRRLKLSLNIYKHDLLLEPSITFKFPIENIITPTTKINQQTNPVFFHHFYQIFNIINLFGEKVELVFHKPGNKANTDILYKCVLRNQLIWINDWDLYCISTTLKKIFMELPKPLLPSSEIDLPIKDDWESTIQSFDKIINNYNKSDLNYGMVLYQLLDLCYRIISKSSTTKHNSLSVAKCLSYCLSQELILLQNKNNVLIVTRLVKNFIEYWPKIQPLYCNRFQSIDQIINGERNTNNILDDSYDLSYDITIEESEESEQDDDYKFNFSNLNILNSLSNKSQNNYNNNTNNLFNNTNNNANSKFHQDAKLITPISSPIGKKTPPTPKSISSLLSTSSSNSSINSHIVTANQENNVSNNQISFNKKSSSSSNSNNNSNHSRKLSDVSNHFQFPPQKYKFDKPTKQTLSSELINSNIISTSISTPTLRTQSSASSLAKPVMNNQPSRSNFTSHSSNSSINVKKPVIRGRKVSELAKLYEERCKGLELLKGM